MVKTSNMVFISKLQFLGSPLSGETHWGKQQPNNYLVEGTSETQDCVMLHNGVWNDEQCSTPHRFVCQIEFLDD